ncbi:MAG: hypothetical protein WA888_00210, partial [Burkholderiaceae bacterium]
NAASLQAARELAPNLNKVVANATDKAVREVIPTQTEGLTQAVVQAGEAAAQRQELASQAVRSSTHQLTEATQAFKRLWWKAALGAAVFGISAILFSAWLTTWWLRSDVVSLLQQRDALRGELVTLQANANAWSEKAGKARLERCKLKGEKRGRLCVRVDEAAGIFGSKDEAYRVIWGY